MTCPSDIETKNLKSGEWREECTTEVWSCWRISCNFLHQYLCQWTTGVEFTSKSVPFTTFSVKVYVDQFTSQSYQLSQKNLCWLTCSSHKLYYSQSYYLLKKFMLINSLANHVDCLLANQTVSCNMENHCQEISIANHIILYD